MRTFRFRKSRGFTLVELLTVIIIIAVLAGLVTGAVNNAVNSANQSVIRQEIGQLEAALNAYKAEFGEYPPDGTDSNEVTKHIKRCYRRVTNNQLTASNVTPQTALYIFLGPHNANPRTFQVIAPTVTGTATTKPFFEFDKSRMSSDLKYVPRGCAQPYIYMKARGQQGKRAYYPGSSFVAYQDVNGLWYNPDSFQIISAGLDNEYGSTGTVKVQDGINSATGNNIVSFSTRLLKDLID